ncbi:uncharacterized protein LOC113239680 [Hyposmocoma kahamanoa]|uniref:uncharacterized protein LOC113239680 n=1 Tax=Hyposmocoma kahamanoa TaxID=1477025 RepID=UPI000E6D8A6C|nr:uncharacterized protein LOC113239680 [Hyposmocoma kahamanoa]
MLIEIPEFRRACFCLPLRYGIILLGYLNLSFAIFYISLEGRFYYHSESSPISLEVGLHRGVPITAPLWFLFLLYSADIVFSVVLLIGAHKKIHTLLNVFYYYNLSTSLAAFVCLFVVWSSCHQCGNFLDKHGLIHLAFIFSSFAVNIYLLLLIRSEVKKLRNCNSYTIVNHTSEVVIEQPMGEGRNPL